MFLRLFILVGVLAAVGSAVDVTINDCPASLPRSRLRAFGHSCYLFVLDHEREFDTAERECEAKGGHLVIIRDLATQQFLYNTLRNEFHNGDALWIGLSDADQEGRFTWVDGSPATFTYWASDQPGIMGGIEDCVAMAMDDGGRWNDYRCSDFLFFHHRQTFVCEYPVVITTPPPTTTAAPASTTAAPASTTAAPASTTAAPASTTAAPPSTTAKQASTTAAPASTTAEPASTTAEPTTATPEPTTTGCPPFECSKDCGLAGFKVDDNTCLLCECEED